MNTQNNMTFDCRTYPLLEMGTAQIISDNRGSTASQHQDASRLGKNVSLEKQ